MNQPEKTEAIYLKKSQTIYKIYGSLILFALFSSTVLRPAINNDSIIDLLVGLPIFGMFVMAPVGLFYSWKSHQRKEGKPSLRFMYFVGHLFFSFLVVVFISAIIKDISMIF